MLVFLSLSENRLSMAGSGDGLVLVGLVFSLEANGKYIAGIANRICIFSCFSD